MLRILPYLNEDPSPITSHKRCRLEPPVVTRPSAVRATRDKLPQATALATAEPPSRVCSKGRRRVLNKKLTAGMPYLGDISGPPGMRNHSAAMTPTNSGANEFWLNNSLTITRSWGSKKPLPLEDQRLRGGGPAPIKFGGLTVQPAPKVSASTKLRTTKGKAALLLLFPRSS